MPPFFSYRFLFIRFIALRARLAVLAAFFLAVPRARLVRLAVRDAFFRARPATFLARLAVAFALVAPRFTALRALFIFFFILRTARLADFCTRLVRINRLLVVVVEAVEPLSCEIPTNSTNLALPLLLTP